MAIVTFPTIATSRLFPRPFASRRFPINSFLYTILNTSYTTTTRLALRNRIRERVFNRFWTDDELNAWITEGLRIWNTLTGYWRITTSQLIGQNTTFYNLADNLEDYMILLRASLVDTHLTLTTLKEFDELNPNWQSTTAGTLTLGAPLGFNMIAFNPPPLADVEVIFDCIRVAPTPEVDTDIIQMGEEDINALIDYVHFTLAFKEGGSELQTAMPFLQNFLSQASKYNAKLSAISVFRKFLGLPGNTQTRPIHLQRMPPR